VTCFCSRHTVISAVQMMTVVIIGELGERQLAPTWTQGGAEYITDEPSVGLEWELCCICHFIGLHETVYSTGQCKYAHFVTLHVTFIDCLYTLTILKAVANSHITDPCQYLSAFQWQYWRSGFCTKCSNKQLHYQQPMYQLLHWHSCRHVYGI